MANVMNETLSGNADPAANANLARRGAAAVAVACLAAAAIGFLAVDDWKMHYRQAVVVEARAQLATLPKSSSSTAPTHADFGAFTASADAQRLANWVVASADDGGRTFAIVDKKAAMVYLLSPSGHLLGASTILVGLARGDDSVPGIGERKMSQIRPQERTTPAGRFVARPGVNNEGVHITWVDYDAAISMHAVRPVVASERRLQRLESTDPKEHRISYGCINVPKVFYETIAAPAFRRGGGMIYVLPEEHPLEMTFPGLAKSRIAGSPAPA